MQLRDRYPDDTVGGCCLVTHRSSELDEPIVDLDTYVETLPPFGRLCISASGVRLLMGMLGWELPSDEEIAELRHLSFDNAVLVSENRRLREALAKIIDGAKLADLVRAAELVDEFPALEAV